MNWIFYPVRVYVLINFLPTRTSDQGNVIELMSVYIYIYIYTSNRKTIY